MRKTMLLVFVLCHFGAVLSAQNEARFVASVSTDSVLLGNYFEVKFSVENGQGEQFEPPAFTDFMVVAGPNMSSSYSMINGKVKQELSYTYFLEPKDVGVFYIGPASIKIDGKTLESQPIEILAVPNPDGIKQKNAVVNPWQQNWELFDTPKIEEAPKKAAEPKKKRKVYRL